MPLWMHWPYRLIDLILLDPFFRHKVHNDCKLPYNHFELILDKMAEITYFLDEKMLFYIPSLLFPILEFGFAR